MMALSSTASQLETCETKSPAGDETTGKTIVTCTSRVSESVSPQSGDLLIVIRGYQIGKGVSFAHRGS